MTSFLPLSPLTDEEILKSVYLDPSATAREVELSHRLENSLDENHKQCAEMRQLQIRLNRYLVPAKERRVSDS